MQLVAYGAQDIYLTGNPQITFFKVVYRRHTNFSMESIQQTWAGAFDTRGRGRCTATIARNGDLVSRLYVEVPYGTADSNRNLGYKIGRNPIAQWIDAVECEIGGQTIDRQYGHWMEAWAELTEYNPSGYCTTGSYTVADVAATTPADNSGTTFQLMSGMGGGFDTATNGSLFVPLRFWFCENPGLALPLIALQYHEVKIILTGQNLPEDAADPTKGLDKAVLWADYIYLDTDERRRFAQVSHEYLITQIQYQNFSTDNKTCTLTFNHPVKELVWTGKWYGPTRAAVPVNVATDWSGDGDLAALQYFASAGSFEPLANNKFQLKLNGHDRFAARNRNYFTMSQVWQYHTGFGSLSASMVPPVDTEPSPDTPLVGKPNVNGQAIAVYSFALKPEEHQPSGTCNFSRIDNAQLVTTGPNTTEPAALPNNIYAVNYNVLRIMSGMGGLAYSN